MKLLESKASNNIIQFTPQIYRDYVLKNPRPYDVVVLFTVESRCDLCELVRPEFDQTVFSFVQERGDNKDFSKERSIFFGVLNFAAEAEIQSIFQDHGFKTVPYLAVSSMNLKRDANLENFFAEEEKWHIGGNEVYDAQKQIDFVNNHLRTDVQIKYTFSSICKKNLVAFCAIAVLMYFVKTVYPILMNQLVWFSIAIMVFLICTGGIVFSILNNMPWFRFERNEYGSVVISEYFMRGQRG